MSILVGNPFLLNTTAATGYQVSRSLRFNSADSAYLSRTPASAGNRKTWTWSGWVKRSNLSSTQRIFSSSNSTNTEGFYCELISGNTLSLYDYSDPTIFWEKTTSQVFRDTGAWFHLLVAFDSTNATAADRVKLYVNGVLVTAFSTSTNPSLNYDSYWNAARLHAIGRTGDSNTSYFNGYLADIYFLDGTATTPSTFAETDAVTGQWVPKTPTSISYGTNGFRLTFSDNSGTTSTTLGKDAAGSNNWTPNNFSVASGSGNDSLVDSPTSYGTDARNGGEVRGNYCTWNPLDTIGGNTFSNGNLDIQTVTAAYGTCRGTIGVSSGKWYWEIDVLDETGGGQIGIIDSVSPLPSEPYLAARGYVYFDFGSKGNNSSQASYGASYTTGDLIGIALDLDAGTLAFYKNGSSQGTAYSSLPSGTVFFPVIADYQSANSSKFALNAGQRAFAYTAPSGFKALCDTNMTAPTIALPNTVMDVKLYTGNGSTQTISGLGFSPDLVWTKTRNSDTSHQIYDIVRGTNQKLSCNTTDAETTTSNSVTAFNSDGFALGSYGSVNTNSNTYAAWCWDAGSSNTTNTAGSITSTVRVNATAGFSIVTYTGSGSNATVGHGLNVAPSFYVVKDRSSAYGWPAYHSSLSSATKYLLLNDVDASITGTNVWNSTAPTSTVFSIGTAAGVNTNGDNYVAYCFAPVTGYSAFGSYTGNGSADGPFVYTGFKVKWLMIKRTDSTSNWYMIDASRSPYNEVNDLLYAEQSLAETVDDGNNGIDFLSNGFKLRKGVGGTNVNASTLIYAAFAENPFQYARAR